MKGAGTVGHERGCTGHRDIHGAGLQVQAPDAAGKARVGDVHQLQPGLFGGDAKDLVGEGQAAREASDERGSEPCLAEAKDGDALVSHGQEGVAGVGIADGGHRGCSRDSR